MRRITYTSPTGATVELVGPQDYAAPLRSWEWSYGLGTNGLSYIRRGPTTVSVECFVTSDGASVLDVDASTGTAGVIAYDGWSRPAVCVSADAGSRAFENASVKLTFALLGEAWMRSTTTMLMPSEAASVGSLDYEYDYPHDYGSDVNKRAVFEVAQPALVRITVFGQCEAPWVSIAGNKYGANVSVPEGARLVIDPTLKGSMNHDAVVVKGIYGDVTDAYPMRMRGAKGSGSYIFEEVPAGVNEIKWPGTFSANVEVIERRSALPWT